MTPEMINLVAIAADTEHGHDGTQATHAEVGHEAEHGGGGLPQMDTSTYASQLFWLAITFTFLYLFLSKAVLPKIGQVLEERRDRIASDLDKASELQSKSEKALNSYETALADARGKALTLANETRERLNKESEARKADVEAGLATKLDEADAKITATKDEALASIRDVANETAAAVVEHLLGESADSAAVQAAVDAELGAQRG